MSTTAPDIVSDWFEATGRKSSRSENQGACVEVAFGTVPPTEPDQQ